MYYRRKIIQSGAYIELYEYELPQRRDFTRKKKEDSISRSNEQEPKSLEKRGDSINRTRTEIRRIINCNLDFSKFYTLTFKENVMDVSVANRHFNKFIMRMTYRFEGLKYICVIEFQKRGAVHYHFLCNLPFVESSEIEKVWGFGFIKIRRIKHVTNLGAYFCKYLQKDMKDERLFNRKKYFCSKNLERPTEVYDNDVVEKLIKLYELESLKTEWESEFENEYTGKVKYRQFKLREMAI